jgi:hypothetical protein
VKRGPLAAALLCGALGLSWQLLTVHFNYGGNLTALFCHGSQIPIPPGLAAEHVYVFPNSGGYDGQSYHYMAHDPFDRSDIGRAVPDPSLRYPRILLPGMAHLFALGRPEWIDVSYLLCGLLFLGLGAYWLAQLLGRGGVHPLFAVLYVAVPVAIISLDRMLVDLAVASLGLGFAVYLDAEAEKPWKLYLVLAAAALCRDTGFLLFAAYAIRLLALRRYRRIAIFASALLPAVLWTLWVRGTLPGGAALGLRELFPVWGMLQAVLHPRHYAFSAPVVAVIGTLWWVQLGGIVLAIALALGNWRKLGADAVRNACFLWACFAIMLPPGVYDDPFAGARILAPMLLFQFLEVDRLTRLPLLLVTPRVWLELTPQVLGIVRGLGL